jgi:hypothetical protein
MYATYRIIGKHSVFLLHPLSSAYPYIVPFSVIKAVGLVYIERLVPA